MWQGRSIIDDYHAVRWWVDVPDFVEIHECEPGSHEVVSAVHLQAFDAGEGPEIATLVAELMSDPTSAPVLSLCARSDGEAVGHVLFSAVTIEGCPSTVARILAPLGVVPHVQGRGIGRRLIRSGLDRLSEEGIDLVFVLGHPGYYPRSGFTPAGPFGLRAPYDLPEEAQEAWMVAELTPGCLGTVRGRVRCGEALMHLRYWRE